MMPLATLYSFRRCPYAMRARLGILLSGAQVMLREIILNDKPETMLAASPKGTVPVLITQDGQVIDESLNIMCWALTKNDPQDILLTKTSAQQARAMALIKNNDDIFKPWLDKYKYADRYPEFSETYAREQGEVFISHLESLLKKQHHLRGHTACIADYAIFPFVRQFAHVDNNWFNTAPYPNVQRWLTAHLTSSPFIEIMRKYPTWLESEQEFIFGAAAQD